MNARRYQPEMFSLALAAMSAGEIAELLHRVGLELGTRLEFDARNYVVRAVACLDAGPAHDELNPATTEPSPAS